MPRIQEQEFHSQFQNIQKSKAIKNEKDTNSR